MAYRQVEQTAEMTIAENKQAPPEKDNVVQRDTAISSLVGLAGDPNTQATNLQQVTNGRLSRAGNTLMQMQNQHGNRYVQRLINPQQRLTVQPKLMLGDVDTPSEREADQIANQAIRGGQVASTPTPVSGALLPVAPEIENAISQARGGGQPLPENTRSEMERSLDSDLSGVRVHTDGRADSLNQSLQAKAFTTGQDIFFRQGTYSPGSSSGQTLIAHELTHVVQQNSKSVPQPGKPLLQRTIYNEKSNEPHVNGLSYQQVIEELQRRTVKTNSPRLDKIIWKYLRSDERVSIEGLRDEFEKQKEASRNEFKVRQEKQQKIVNVVMNNQTTSEDNYLSPQKPSSQKAQRGIQREKAYELLSRYQFGKLEKEEAVNRAKKVIKAKKVKGGDTFTLKQFESMLEAAPPKSGAKSSSNTKERQWFENLKEVKPGSLKPGDVLIRKFYGGHKVSKAQMTFRGQGSPHGSKYSVHAALVIDTNTIAEASGSKNEVAEHKISSSDSGENNFLVYRPQDREEARSAVAVSKWITSGNLKYAKTHCVKAIGGYKYGKDAKERAKKLAKTMKKPVKKRSNASTVLGVEKMMCSEFVAFCFQNGGAEDPYIKLDAKHTAPIILENYLVTNPDRFKLIGKLLDIFVGEPEVKKAQN